MELGLRDHVVLVTGATGAIGSAVARVLAAEGATLVLHGRNDRKLAALATSLGRPLTVAADLETLDTAQHVVDFAVRHAGRLDALVSCAGATRGMPFADTDDAGWKRNLEVKLFATIRLVRAALVPMRARRSGRIVLVVGNNGREPEPSMLPGSVANAGLLALVRGLSREIAADGVTLNAVNPGPVHSERWRSGMEAEAARTGRSVAECEAPHLARIPLGRFAAPEDVARHAVFLASPAAGHMTGAAVMVDGGAARGVG
jgi:NAD(P)-dependent dehydrogenase (short-subunit alcohol dehydrogenase family)